jgi:methionyl-tRNA formyltransferase
MGTPDFAVPSLEALIAAGYPIAAVVTGADKPRGRGQRLTPTPVKEVTLRRNIPLLQPASVKDPAFVAALRDYAPDLMVVVAFRVLPRDVFTIPRWGTFNLHASLLPRYRGAAPINWALMNGDSETGVTTFFLEDAVDTGNILLQKCLPIGPDDDAGSLHDGLATLGAGVVVETVQRIEAGTLVPQSQNSALTSLAPKIFREQCQVNWNAPAVHVHNFIRGLSPHPAAWTMHDGRLLKLYKSRVLTGRCVEHPGTVRVEGGSFSVVAGDGTVVILELQQEGHRRMTTQEFLRGYTIATGDTLASPASRPSAAM